jgi:hypothetical protein
LQNGEHIEKRRIYSLLQMRVTEPDLQSGSTWVRICNPHKKSGIPKNTAFKKTKNYA